jgi:hypothetical protein
MQVLVIAKGNNMVTWLVGEPAESAEAHIRNGFPEQMAAWEAGELTVAEIEVPDEDRFCAEVCEIRAGQVQRKVLEGGGV